MENTLIALLCPAYLIQSVVLHEILLCRRFPAHIPGIRPGGKGYIEGHIIIAQGAGMNRYLATFEEIINGKEHATLSVWSLRLHL